MASRNPSRTYDTLPRNASANATNLPSVRRNLFPSHAARRPAATSSLSANTSTTTQTVHSDNSASNKEDIIMRDEAGDFRLELPTQTPMPLREEEADNRDADNRLIEQYYTHRHQIDPNALRAALQQSLQASLASLEEDKWQFGEDDTNAP